MSHRMTVEYLDATHPRNPDRIRVSFERKNLFDDWELAWRETHVRTSAPEVLASAVACLEALLHEKGPR